MSLDAAPHEFSVRSRSMKDAAGGWSSTVVAIYQGDVQIGEYVRNHPHFARETFHPFQIQGRWYALYSRDCTVTRIMSLPDCRDIGGEDPSPVGFCPCDYFVPSYRLGATTVRSGRSNHDFAEILWPEDFADGSIEQEAQAGAWTIGPVAYVPFGFVAGCVWGDDATWKVQWLDLSRADSGILVREERFGYLELPPRMRLRQAIDMRGWTPGLPNIRIACHRGFSLAPRPGKS